jgi:beta-lactam-binding protein with PASTA domain
VNYVSAPQWPHGAVIDQSPLGGARLPATATIELTVAN